MHFCVSCQSSAGRFLHGLVTSFPHALRVKAQPVPAAKTLTASARAGKRAVPVRGTPAPRPVLAGAAMLIFSLPAGCFMLASLTDRTVIRLIHSGPSGAHGRGYKGVTLGLKRQWDGRVEQWHSHVTSAAAFEQVLDRVINLSRPRRGDACVDLGAGTGFVTMALAPLVSRVLAVDLSDEMASSLASRAAEQGLGNVSTQVSDIKDFQLPPASIDIVVSSYALHHLAHADKRVVVARAAQWLRPGAGSSSPT